MERPLRLLVLRTGEVVDPVLRRGDSFVSLFARGLRHAPFPVEVRDVDARPRAASDPLPALLDVDGVVVTGSSAMVEDDTPAIRWSIRLIKRLLDEEIPLLGVCFGHQLLGAATGADVGPNPRGRQMGGVDVARSVDDDPLLGALPARFRAQTSHRDVIRDPGPRLTVVGTAPHDPVHAVRAGPVAWGVQYHPEFTVDVMRDYLESRREVLDRDRGAGATDERLRALADTPDARATLARFAEVARAHRAAS